MARVLRFAGNRGKGHAVRAGLLAAQAPIALFSDADLSTPITELPKIVEPIEAGNYDLVFGSRALDRKLIGHRQPWRREQGGKVFNAIVRLTTGLPFFDTQCGYKAFRMEAFRSIVEQARIDGFGFDVELLFLAQRAGLRILEVPVRWDHHEGSKVHIVRDSLAHVLGSDEFAFSGRARNAAHQLDRGDVALTAPGAQNSIVRFFQFKIVRLTVVALSFFAGGVEAQEIRRALPVNPPVRKFRRRKFGAPSP